MDESAAIAIADQLARAHCEGRFERLSASRVDREALKSSYEEDWREGRFPADVTEAEFREFTANLELSPFWTVGYLLYLDDEVTVGTVTIDEASGAAEWDVLERPAE